MSRSRWRSFQAVEYARVARRLMSAAMSRCPRRSRRSTPSSTARYSAGRSSAGEK